MLHHTSTKPLMKLVLASPRGFCAGVERAVRMVKEALALYGKPVYVRGDIVHNHDVVKSLKYLGAIFVDRIADVPRGSVLLLSAHGSCSSVIEDGHKRDLTVIDAICPLVLKVHKQVRAFIMRGVSVVFIGHRHHPETRGVLGQNRQTKMTVLESVNDVHKMPLPLDNASVGYVTQTTLNPTTIKPIVDAMKERFGERIVRKNHQNDVCYATINRQEATKIVAKQTSVVLIAGSKHSSNTQRLKEIAQQQGTRAFLVDVPQSLPWDAFTHNIRVGIAAGASAPESLVTRMTQALAKRYTLEQKTLFTVQENIHFPSPFPLMST